MLIFCWLVYYLVKRIVVKLLGEKRRHLLKKKKEKFQREILANFSLAKEDPKLDSQTTNILLEGNINQIIDLYKQNRLTCVQAVNFFSIRCSKIGYQKLQAAVHANYEAAIIRAKFLDKENKEGRVNNYSLFGIPFSVKECIKQKGFPTTCGFETRIEELSDSTCPLIAALIKEGAIPIVRSNVPQYLLSFESDNEIYGIAKNPHNLKRTPGGSSGGESALIASGCTVFGIGSDIGGSIRIPSTFTGIFGFKPTNPRITKRGNASNGVLSSHVSDQCIVQPTIGPLARSNEDLSKILNIIMKPEISNEFDPILCPLEWRIEKTLPESLKNIKVGIIRDYPGVFKVASSYQRALDITKKKILDLGFEVEELTLEADLCTEIYKSVSCAFFVGGNVTELGECTKYGVELNKGYKEALLARSLPNWLVKLSSKILGKFESKRIEMVAESSLSMGPREFEVKMQKYINKIEEFLIECRRKKITHFVSPGFSFPANLLGEFDKLIPGVVPTLIWNGLRCPAGTLPITTVLENEQNYTDEIFPNDRFTFGAQRTLTGSAGMPIGVQISSYPYEDEECLALLRLLEQKMGLKANLKLDL